MKTVKSLLAFLVFACSMFGAVTPGGNVAVAVNPSGQLSFLQVDALGALMLAAASPVVPLTGPGGNIAIAVNPDGELAFLHTDENGALIVSGGGGGGMFEAGTGYTSVKSKGVKYAGQITLTNGSPNITGIDTEFLKADGPGDFSWEYTFVVVDSANTVYYIAVNNVFSDTSADIWGISDHYVYGAGTSNFPGVTGTYDFYVTYSNAADPYSYAIGPNAVVNGTAQDADANSGMAIGYGAYAIGRYGQAVGNMTRATGRPHPAVAYGSGVTASGEISAIFGIGGTVSANRSISITNGAGDNVTPNSIELSVILDNGFDATPVGRLTNNRLEVTGTSGASDLVLKSPNGSRWKITVSDAGVITATSLP